MEEEKNKTGKDPGKASHPKQGSVLKELLSGSMVSDKILLKNFWYILMLTILGAIYIANRFNAEKITRESNKLSREVRDLRAEALSTSADLMEASRQSEVYRMVKDRGLGLEELKTPPYRLIVSK
jgi:hypothetical protein